MATTFDIVELIEKNPVSRLSRSYNGKLLNKIKNNFTEDQQQLFVASFYCYLNYNQTTDFVIDLDNVWEWLNYNQKDSAKRVLERHFVIDIDYICLVRRPAEQKTGRGGHNKETILMNIKTFKLFCIKSGTKKADEIHEYFIKLEELLQETLIEESNELRLQLEEKDAVIEQKTTQLEQQKEQSAEEKEILRERTILEQFPLNTQCVYYGKIANTSTKGEPLIKFGNSNNLNQRVEQHKKTYTNFRLINAFKVSNKIHIENALKSDPNLKKLRRSINIGDMNYTELLNIYGMTYEMVDELIKRIIREQEYNIENYKLLLDKNEELVKENYNLTAEKEELERNIKRLENKIGAEPNKIVAPTLSYVGCGCLLYAFQCGEHRYKYGIVRKKGFDERINMHKAVHPDGEIKYTKELHYGVFEKTVGFFLKERLTQIDNTTVEGPLDEIKLIFDIIAKFEDAIVSKVSLEDIYRYLCGVEQAAATAEYVETNPEIPAVRKRMRAIDQIDPPSGRVIATYPSIEAAGRGVGLPNGTAIGIAVRNKSRSRGFLWKYAGVSAEDQMTCQPVIRVCCSTGEKKEYRSMADAAKEAGISVPAIRNRIITDVHTNGFHWVFNRGATHWGNEEDKIITTAFTQPETKQEHKTTK